MRVCYVVNGVSETSVPATIATAVTERYDVTIDILAWFDASSFRGDEEVDVTCLEAPRSGLGVDLQTYRNATEKLSGYDLVQVHECHSGAIAKLITKQLGIPTVSREGNMRKGFTKKGRIANGVTNRLADRIVCNSQAVYNSFKRWEKAIISDESVEIIPNGVNLAQIDAVSDSRSLHRRYDISEDSIVIGTASVISEQKSLDTLVRGVEIANTQCAELIELVIMGDGPLRGDIEQLATDCGISDQLTVTGYIDRAEVFELLNQIDIYAMPSLWEGFSSAAVEALAARNACVFSDIEAFALPYNDVALFHTLRDPNDLANRLVTLVDSPERRSELAHRGRELVEKRYTIESVSEKYMHLYTELTSHVS